MIVFSFSTGSKDMQVVLGGVDVTTEEPSDQVISVERAIIHSNYSESENGTASNDLGEAMRLHRTVSNDLGEAMRLHCTVKLRYTILNVLI